LQVEPPEGKKKAKMERTPPLPHSIVYNLSSQSHLDEKRGRVVLEKEYEKKVCPYCSSLCPAMLAPAYLPKIPAIPALLRPALALSLPYPACPFLFHSWTPGMIGK
jgi:hypothetical protein